MTVTWENYLSAYTGDVANDVCHYGDPYPMG